jgi:hypothetical protein
MDGQQGSDRAERAARNQALFREVNERLEELARTFADVAGTAVFTCECFDLSCVEQIDIPLAEYEAIRSHPTTSSSSSIMSSPRSRTSYGRVRGSSSSRRRARPLQ